jgi:hypothetical protein
MSNVKEYLNSDSVIYSLNLNGTLVYLLIFNINSDWGKKIKAVFQKETFLRLKYDELNEFFKVSIKLDEVQDDNQDLIRQICSDYLNERAFLVKNEEDQIIISDINCVETAKVLGVFLKEYNEISDILRENDKVSISDFTEEASEENGNFFFK